MRLEIKKRFEALEKKQAIKEAESQHPIVAPLEQVTKPNLKTAEAAFYLNRATQTLNIWACRSGKGPMVPKRIGGCLAWSTAEVKKLVGVSN